MLMVMTKADDSPTEMVASIETETHTNERLKELEEWEGRWRAMVPHMHWLHHLQIFTDQCDSIQIDDILTPITKDPESLPDVIRTNQLIVAAVAYYESQMKEKEDRYRRDVHRRLRCMRLYDRILMDAENEVIAKMEQAKFQTRCAHVYDNGTIFGDLWAICPNAVWNPLIGIVLLMLFMIPCCLWEDDTIPTKRSS